VYEAPSAEKHVTQPPIGQIRVSEKNLLGFFGGNIRLLGDIPPTDA